MVKVKEGERKIANRMNSWVKKEFQELRQNAKCAGSGPHFGRIQFAHVEKTKLEGMGRGRKERLMDIRKNPDKYVPLCEACHLEFDRED